MIKPNEINIDRRPCEYDPGLIETRAVLNLSARILTTKKYFQISEALIDGKITRELMDKMYGKLYGELHVLVQKLANMAIQTNDIRQSMIATEIYSEILSLIDPHKMKVDETEQTDAQKSPN